MALTYSKLKEIYDGRRKDMPYRAMRGYNNCRVRGDSRGCMIVKMHATDIAVFWPDGKIDFNAGGWEDTPSTRSRIWEITGVNIWTNSKQFKHYDQPIRMSIGHRWQEHYPYTPGSVKNGEFIDPPKVDKVQVANRKVIAQTTGKLAKLTKLARALARMDAIDQPTEEMLRWTNAGGVFHRLMNEVEAGVPNPMKAATLLIAFGKNRSTMHGIWAQLVAVNHCLNLLRADLLRDAATYDMVEVPCGHDLKQAA